MAKRKSQNKARQNKAVKTNQALSKEDLQTRLNQLLEQHKYRQALEQIKQARRTNPDVQFSPNEATLWSLRGQQEFSQDNFKQAESSFRRALELGLNGEAHYWIAKCQLALDRLDDALALIQQAFDDQLLPQGYAACYLKLLLLKGETATVEHLIEKQAKRFFKPQIHWARAALALQAGDPETALPLLKKVKHNITPGDVPAAWLAYTQQQLDNWDAAASLLKLNSLFSLIALKQPILNQLAVFQAVKTKQITAQRLQNMGLVPTEQIQMVTLLDTLDLIDEGDYHEAAHSLSRLGRNIRAFPPLERLHRPLLMLAGQQAFDQDELNCAVEFWQPLATEKDLDPQLAVNLHETFLYKGSHKEAQRLLTRLLNWVEREAKQRPQQWPPARLNATLAHIHCLIADTWISLRRERTAFAAVRQAERLWADSPEVMARQGIVAAEWDKNYPEAVRLLTQSLEKGCRWPEAYERLLDCLQEQGDEAQEKDIRRRFGKEFGDLALDVDIQELPRWIQ